MKETAFLYFPISLFACSHYTCSPASDENPLHSDTCDREANNQICGKYRKVVSFTSYLNLFSGVENLACYPLDPALQASWKLVIGYPDSRLLSRSSREFIRFLKQKMQSDEA